MCRLPKKSTKDCLHFDIAVLSFHNRRLRFVGKSLFGAEVKFVRELKRAEVLRAARGFEVNKPKVTWGVLAQPSLKRCGVADC